MTKVGNKAANCAFVVAPTDLVSTDASVACACVACEAAMGPIAIMDAMETSPK